MVELAELVATAVVTALKKENVIGIGIGNGGNEPKKTEKTAYQKTEQLLENYNAFKKIIAERMAEIENIRKYGVPQTSRSIVEYTPGTGGTVSGIVLPEDSVESAVRTVQASVQGTVQAVTLIEKSMAALRTDPYYKVLEMLYFEGRTQEDIAFEFNCAQNTISYNKNRLVKELTMRIFPNQVIEEMTK
jgi:DNA-directed RNA polymerase specialized sigma subunit